MIASFLQPQPDQIERVEAVPAPEEATEAVEATPIQEAEEVADDIEETEEAAAPEVVETPEKPANTVKQKGTISQDQILAEFLAASGEIELPKGKYDVLITTEPMHEGSRLTWMAKRYYGAKIYWPYLYDANRDVIINPSRIEVGTPIRVPKLTALQLDTTNAETKAQLTLLLQEAEAACKK